MSTVLAENLSKIYDGGNKAVDGISFGLGQGSMDTFLQMAYAIAFGFAFAMCFSKSGSLIPCIITHSIVNLTSKFSNHNISEQTESYWSYGATAFIILVAGTYALYLRKVNIPKDEKTDCQV